MAAYIIVSIKVQDPVRYEAYKSMVPSSLSAYGGKFIVRGGKIETLEGGWSHERFVIIEFPSADQAKAWWGSAEYAEAKALRQATSVSEMIVVEGV